MCRVCGVQGAGCGRMWGAAAWVEGRSMGNLLPVRVLREVEKHIYMMHAGFVGQTNIKFFCSHF